MLMILLNIWSIEMKLNKEQEEQYKKVMKSLRKWRLDNKWGLREFAIKLNVSAAEYSRVEGCFSSTDNIGGIACTLDKGCRIIAIW